MGSEAGLLASSLAGAAAVAWLVPWPLDLRVFLTVCLIGGWIAGDPGEQN